MNFAVLEYHDLLEQPLDSKDLHYSSTLDKVNFQAQMEWLYKNQYQTRSLDEILKNPNINKVVVITFDDGHYSNYELAYPILRQHQFTATFFIVPSFIGQKNYLTQTQIQEMMQFGMRFESHSLSHPNLLDINDDTLRRELKESKIAIERITGQTVNHFCVPYGYYDNRIVHAVKDCGYRTIVTEDFGFNNIVQNVSFQKIKRLKIRPKMSLYLFDQLLSGNKIILFRNTLQYYFIKYTKRLIGFQRYRAFKKWWRT